jgi:beta-mannosidase
VLVSPHFEGGTLSVYIVSDKVEAQEGQLRLRIMDFDGKVIKETSQTVTVAPLASKIYQQITMTDLLSLGHPDMSHVVGAADLTIGGKEVSSNVVFLFRRSKFICCQLPYRPRSAKRATGLM